MDILENLPNLHTIIYMPRAYSSHVSDRIIQKDTNRAHKALAASKFSLYVHGSSDDTGEFLRRLDTVIVARKSKYFEQVNLNEHDPTLFGASDQPQSISAENIGYINRNIAVPY